MKRLGMRTAAWIVIASLSSAGLATRAQPLPPRRPRDLGPPSTNPAPSIPPPSENDTHPIMRLPMPELRARMEART